MRTTRRLVAAVLAVGIGAAMPVTAMADAKDDRIAELEAQVEKLQETVHELTEKLEKATPASTDQDEYKLGETWVVEGQWKVTIDSVEETAERNEFADQNPAAVYVVSYTYENLGYESDIQDLFLSLDTKIVDAAGKMGYSYPGDITMYPQPTPVGATCEAQVCIGVDNAGDFQLYADEYDGNDNEQKAVFDIAVEQ